MRWVLCSVGALVLAGGACDRDKVLAGRRALATEPAKGITLLQQASAERTPCFECEAYLGLAFERTGDLAAAAGSYEKAVQMPEAATRPEQVALRLIDVYEKLFEAAKGAPDRLAIATKAAPLEAKLKLGRAWANEFLAEKLKKDLAAATTTEAVDKTEKAIQALYLPADAKRQAAADATDALRAAFARQAARTFVEKVGAEMAEAGEFDADKSEVSVVNKFRIPTKKDDEQFDPDDDAFKANLRKAACLPLRDKLDAIIGKAATAVGAKKPPRADVDVLFAKFFNHAQAGFATWNGEKKPPAGQTYVCLIRVPLQELLGELFRYKD